MISNPSPKRNIHRVGRRRFKLRYLLLAVMGFIVLCVSRPYQTPETRPNELSETDIPVVSAVPGEETVSVEPQITVETYKIRRGDTLYDIARYKLGCGGRWPEIYDLNQEILQDDFDYLTPGMELVLPEQSSDAVTQRPASQRAR